MKPISDTADTRTKNLDVRGLDQESILAVGKAREDELAQARLLSSLGAYGRGYWDEEVIKLVIWPNPDGKYLIKGDGSKVWKQFNLRNEHRRTQGIIHGKRCGTTVNLGELPVFGCSQCRRWRDAYLRILRVQIMRFGNQA